ncbi:MAG: hypothetical protein ACRCT8_12540 [Lacipirellulaceae bacterium]
MKLWTRALVCFALLTGAGPTRAATVSVEVASQGGAQATAPQKWLQLFADAGVTNVRVRGANPGDKPAVIELGSPQRPMPKLVAVLTPRGELVVPGARFTTRDSARLRDYLARLQADGAAALTAERGRFGLTEREFTDVFDELSKPLGEVDEGDTLATLVAAQRGAIRWSIEGAARGPMTAGKVGADGVAVQGLARGSALAALLRAEGLAIVPEKPPGKALRLRVAPAIGLADLWPVGHDPEGSPGETAPILFESLEVEVEGYTLAEALDAVAPRLTHNGAPLPIVWDRYALRRDGIDPATKSVRVAAGRMYYKRLVDRLVAQARLAAKLRVDEAGQPFLWLTR